MDIDPDSRLEKVKKERERFIHHYLGSKVRDAKEYGILTQYDKCYSYSHEFTDAFVNYVYRRITPKDPVILNDLKSLRFDDHTLKPTLVYYGKTAKDEHHYTGGILNEADFELWERIKVLIPIISEAMEDWFNAKKEEKLNRMTKPIDSKTNQSKPIVTYKLTKIIIEDDETEENMEKNEN